jgi:hypothetical protein
MGEKIVQTTANFGEIKALGPLEVDSSAIFCCMAKNLRYNCKQS